MPHLTPRWPPPGRYIVAVSGGADSMVLLDMLAAAAAAHGYELIVAHFDHGLRSDSAADSTFVQAAAARYGLEFASTAANLGQASEAAARTARHAWLEAVRDQHQALAVLTAHHQDDLLETSLLNLARGSGRLGLAPMQTSATILRPLIDATRADLRAYAAIHQITWREDPTNADITNSRNLLRHKLLPAATPEWRTRYLELVTQLAELNKKVAQSISGILEPFLTAADSYTFPTNTLRGLSDLELEELLLGACRVLRPGIQLDRRLIIDIAGYVRTGRPHTRRPLRLGVVALLGASNLTVTTKPPH